ncbi:hypothetical protein J2Y55_005718 [Bosea sp. BE125]|uniref:hypothetical protein n=1 Tax=Bosea sp. BE125 TaxID=2817909 RepID=UPI00285C9F5D|nr:hypothetical protein [Bosea sp. BE125]MDR6874680.1 hypothetical protein [Bosea sp. BE125]
MREGYHGNVIKPQSSRPFPAFFNDGAASKAAPRFDHHADGFAQVLARGIT